MCRGAAIVLAMAGCEGKIGDPGGGLGSASSAECSRILPAPVRRLSRAEYLATVRDLFPGIDLGSLTVGKDPTDQGFENRAELLNPEPLLVEQYSTAASEVAATVIADPTQVLPCTPTNDTDTACGAQFLEAFGQRAFRRPLTADEARTYMAFFKGELAAGSGFKGAVQLTIESILQAPQFLYRLEFGQTDPAAPDQARLSPFEVATRMSYLLWGSAPDTALLEKATANQLSDPADREKEARRMLSDTRARDMLIEFHRQWLDFDQLANEPKDPTTYPSYTPELEAAIREESDRFVADVMWKGDGSVRSLLTTTATEVNAPLAALYGVPAPAAGWAEVTLNPDERAGFLTRANFLASRAHKMAGSPPLRAVFILKRLLCQTPPKPPANANLSEPAAQPDAGQKTNRQLFEERLAPQPCASCHGMFMGLGYAFENYDGIGHYRTIDNGLPVDATGTFKRGDIDWQLSGAIDLSTKLAESPDVESCVASNWYEYAVGREKQDSDACHIDALGQALADAGGDIREMLVAFVKTPEFVIRPVVKP